MSKKLTPWFPASVKPVREGVYETRALPISGLVRLRAFFNGYWSVGGCTPEHAVALHHGNQISATQRWEWRGLAQPPKE